MANATTPPTTTRTDTRTLTRWFDRYVAAHPQDSIGDAEEALATLLYEQGYHHARARNPHAEAGRRAYEIAIAWGAQHGITEDDILTAGFTPAAEMAARNEEGRS